jgi:hypothetical protein
VEEHCFSSVQEFTSKFPQATQIQNLEKLAIVSNFLVKGKKYSYIKEIAIFQRDYCEKVRNKSTEVVDISQMKKPTIENGKLIFYVEEEETERPYRVSLSYPIREKECDIKYETL